MKVRTVIVDDEPLARGRIRQLLAAEADMEVIAECRDGREAVEEIRGSHPDLVFLDIQMPEMDGFDVLAELTDLDLPVVVFVTAYDHYAVRAFEVNALDYLLKPFDSQRFQTALARARRQLAERDTAAITRRTLALLEEIEQRRHFLQRFVVRTSGRVLFVNAREVDCIEADGNYMRLHVAATSHLVRDTMDTLEKRLDPSRFLRIHRSWIVNLDRVQELQPWFHGGWAVVLRGGRRILAGRKYRDALGTMMGGER